ncbi:hypothetical protein AHF37_11266 [Paragonimus kellicotti]|nr:hypothetical protein AHF37_11266 [Paragonimus kellicotti]
MILPLGVNVVNKSMQLHIKMAFKPLPNISFVHLQLETRVHTTSLGSHAGSRLIYEKYVILWPNMK